MFYVKYIIRYLRYFCSNYFNINNNKKKIYNDIKNIASTK